MDLIEVGSGEWQVLLVGSPDGCQILDHIMPHQDEDSGEWKDKLWGKMFNRLSAVIPEKGPQFGELRKDKVENYGDGIGAFKEKRSKGPNPRVYFFRDGRQIICTIAFDKRDENDKVSAFIEKAKETKRGYLAAKQRSQLKIVKFEDL